MGHISAHEVRAWHLIPFPMAVQEEPDATEMSTAYGIAPARQG